jgi:hypothetical protein
LLYETSLTLAADGRTQDVSTVPNLDEVLAVAWPWREGDNFSSLAVRWRVVGDHMLYLETHSAPQTGDVLRLRHTCRHTLDGLGGATTTTIPDRHQPLVTLAAALWAIDLRVRQMSENPAIPQDAAPLLQTLRRDLHTRYEEGLGRVLNRTPLRWELIGEG